MLKTIVNDVTDIPYSVDVTIDHQDCGLVSSVFNLDDSSDSNINSIFTKIIYFF
jgi:hypothetical protein